MICSFPAIGRKLELRMRAVHQTAVLEDLDLGGEALKRCVGGTNPACTIAWFTFRPQPAKIRNASDTFIRHMISVKRLMQISTSRLVVNTSDTRFLGRMLDVLSSIVLASAPTCPRVSQRGFAEQPIMLQ